VNKKKNKIEKNWVEVEKHKSFLIVACPAVSTLSLLSLPSPKKNTRYVSPPVLSPDTRLRP